MWKLHVLSNFDFMKKIWSFMIFLTLFSKNSPFLDNFDNNLFLLKWFTLLNKNCSKLSFKLSLGLILFVCIDHLSKNWFLSILSKNGEFVLNKVKKIIRYQNFFHKIKIAQNVWFPHRFSIWGPKVTPKVPPDGHCHPRVVSWPRSRQDEPFGF